MDQILSVLPVFLALVSTGIIAGLLAGLLGVGGGIVIVPVLYYIFQYFGVSATSAMVIATTTSLATIVPTSISSIKAHHANGNVDWLLLRWLSAFIVIGVVAGSLLVSKVGGAWLSGLFGIVATISALNMLLRSNAAPVANALPGKFGQGIMGSCIGFLSVMVGIGGGTLTVPTLTAFNYPAHRAVGTAAAVGLLIALPGVATMLLAGNVPIDAPIGNYGLVNWLGFVCIVPLTVYFSPIGARIGKQLDSAKLKKVFALVLAFTGIRMLLQAF
ncbi:sulfite exporter TauE/SafE family protein [Alginatibacterium sediminis]|uniref:Probable membrane transporter protein n=1 Tax=Alginatibacterium sediminis TaxID=2164068 RepID=A0A420EGT1_9ALTE|nr:sulfite exporter TauE/SafE family protein [Alginatibacterium sediminis]RKF19899.1 sulfite exporter TauE/SafE family protein [Alginatibacterium sediminis]